ncbi:hypothetical protein NAPIS_ORF00505 [Vairimorpha apis BRL 01]|uniref:Uncharacterized protein n=1 Tax=Vairimorpha apis BRL 01 TaxID=1037528 RepID=T0LC98_9MICR|nr:hypothetical protein NAPIS_ORF01845 [Vairimorpha apis BRL 01]EQB61924.1 hypothetical protein NAPIS_ORF00505 [Vairimorpha apis BRL 01]
MDHNKKFLPIIKVGGRKVIKKSNIGSNNNLRSFIDLNKEILCKTTIDEIILEKNSKILKFKNNIKIIYDENKKPIGIFLTGLPEIKTKIITNIPENFENAVIELNKEFFKEESELEKLLTID